MTLPASATKVHLDAATDDPKQARSELASLVDKFNDLLTHMTGSTILSTPLGAGQGLESDGAGGLRVKLDGATLARSASGMSAAAATETQAGVAEVATQNEANTGTDDARFLTPAKLSNISPASVTLAAADQVLILDASDSNRLKRATISQRIVKRVDDEEAAHSTSTATMPTGDTAPTNTDGAEVLSLSITPASSSNTILLNVTAVIGATAVRDVVATLLRGTTVIAAVKQYVNGIGTICFNVEDAPATTSATTYSVRVGVTAAATWSINGDGSSRQLGGKIVSSLSAMEYAP